MAFVFEFCEDIDHLLTNGLKGESAQWFAKQAIYLSRLPSFLRGIVRKYLTSIEKDEIQGNVLKYKNKCSADQFK
jgi:hypothetical protein